jgi:hypothetical protein
MLRVARYYVLPSVTAALLFALPYGMLVPVCELVLEVQIDWPVRLAAITTSLGAVSVVPFVCYLVARLCWSGRTQIVRERLYGLPLSIAAVAAGVLFFVLSETGAVGVLLAFLYTIGIAGFGVASSAVWEALGYPGSIEFRYEVPRGDRPRFDAGEPHAC